ncbi:GGDEF domain-containing protein [Methylobacter sp. S3L5C]|uniref:GGDEF domain-containing protein n=1 Tax=Methylobacter sp. S3L5C TaxID=2839024 RepID=UPI001FAC875B|nr:GGDEF domain-containing protein [Methylobacter sp. S3L5C]UOA07665.1 GGDEF domain-containing protein [Methylobacter sp. S3L5C]
MIFDIRTMLMTMSLLTLLFSGLLILAGLHVGNARGVQQWALGSLYIGLGLGSAYIQQGPIYNTWLLVFAATLLAGGLGLQFNGIQVFKTGRYNKYIPWLLAGLMFIQNIWFVVIDPDIHSRVIANSLLYGLGNAACAQALFIRIEQPLRTAYWFTGTSFAIFATLLLARAITIFNAQPETYSLYSPAAFNTASVFIGIMSEMCVTFGFVLMLNSRLAAELQKLALLDPLTGALNRRSLEQEADRLSARCTRTGDIMAVMMIDLDDFKSINDRYGHPVGDAVLINLAEVAQKIIRRDDYFARYGGEEFCILLPSTSEKDAWILAERLRQTYADMLMKFDGKSLHSTISIGVSDSLHVGVEFTLLIAAADQAMYIAKQEGRNRVMLHSSCLS